MSALTWTDLKSAALRRLIETSPHFVAHAADGAGKAVLVVITLSQAQLRAALVDNRLEAIIQIKPTPALDDLAREVLDHIREVISDHASKARQQFRFDLGTWLDEQGFAGLVSAMLAAGAPADEITALAELTAASVKVLNTGVSQLRRDHLEAVLLRDLPHAVFLRRQLTSTAEWLLAPDFSGTKRRREVLERRLQAISLFGALSGVLREPAITATVDAGEPLIPVLTARLGVTEAELRTLRGARLLRAAIEGVDDFRVAVEELKAHSVRRHEWPGEGRADAAEAWEASPWVKHSRSHLIRCDYIGDQSIGVPDVLIALMDDLLRPIAADRMIRLDLVPIARVRQFAHSFEFRAALDAPERRRFLTGLREVIIGTRGANAFHQAVKLWHRRAASLSALRHERRTARPGWPALCEPWRSEDGRYEIVALASAADLVEEGNQLRHCVGGYYDVCRRGDTQILSLRREGARIATIEILLQGEIETPALEVGQFEAVGNTRPPDDLHDALRAFLRAIRSGAHPTKAAALARYRRRMRKTSDDVWRSDALPLAHSREAFPLYRPLLPRCAPADFDEWRVRSGLVETIDHALLWVAGGPPGRAVVHSLSTPAPKENDHASL